MAGRKRRGAAQAARRGVDHRCGGMIELLPHQLLFIPETDAWPRSAVFISAGMIMIKVIRIPQAGRSRGSSKVSGAIAQHERAPLRCRRHRTNINMGGRGTRAQTDL